MMAVSVALSGGPGRAVSPRPLVATPVEPQDAVAPPESAGLMFSRCQCGEFVQLLRRRPVSTCPVCGNALTGAYRWFARA